MKTAVFDFDGTVAASFPLIGKVFSELFKEVEPSITEKDMRKFFGPSERGILWKALGRERGDKAFVRFLELYEQFHDELLPDLIPGIRELLIDLNLRGVRCCLLTGRSQESADISFGKLNITGLFEKVYVGSPEGECKEQRLRELEAELKLQPSDIVYIGDSGKDIDSCRLAGVEIISANYAHTYDTERLERKNPGKVAKTVEELKSMLYQTLGLEKETKAVGFDFDGTLAHTYPLIFKTYHDVFAHYGIEMGPVELVSHFGPDERGLIRNVLGEERTEEALSLYLDLYNRYQKDLIPVLNPEIKKAIVDLKQKGVLVFLITGRGEKATELSFKMWNIQGLFDRCYYGSVQGINKADNFKKAIADYQLDAADFIYVGDTLPDIVSARQDNLKVVSVNYFQTEDYDALEKANPGMVVKDPSKLAAKLEAELKI